MSPNARALFTGEPVEVKLDEARDAIDLYVRRLGPTRLGTPSLAAQLAERALPGPPRLVGRIRYRLFETEIVDADARPSRRRRGVGIEAIVPFRGAADFFILRAGPQPLHAPKGLIRARSLILTAVDPDASAAELIERLDDQLETIRRELEEQRRRCEAMRDDLETAARRSVEARLRRMAAMAEVDDVLSARGWLAAGR